MCYVTPIKCDQFLYEDCLYSVEPLHGIVDSEPCLLDYKITPCNDALRARLLESYRNRRHEDLDFKIPLRFFKPA